MTTWQTITITQRAQVPVVTAGDGVALLLNVDPVNTIFLSGDYGAQGGEGNSVALPPNAAVAVDGKQDVFAVTAQNLSAQMAIIPGGTNFFLSSEIITKSLIIAGTGTPPPGIFLYDGLAALGNVPIGAAVAPGVTVDPFGNNIIHNNITASFVRGLSDTTLVTVTGGALTACTPHYPIWKNDPNVGTIYRISYEGSFVQGTPQQAISFVLSMPAAGDLTLDLTLASTNFSAGQPYQYSGYFDVGFTAVGASGNANVLGFLNIWDTTSGVQISVSPIDIGNVVDTTASTNTIDFEMKWGGTPGGQSFNCYQSHYLRIGM